MSQLRDDGHDLRAEVALARARISTPRTGFNPGQLPLAVVGAVVALGSMLVLAESWAWRIGATVVTFVGLLIDRRGGDGAPVNASVIEHALLKATTASLWFRTPQDGLVFFCPDGVFVESSQDFFHYHSEWGPRSGSWPRLRSVSYDEAKHLMVLQNDPTNDDPQRTRVEVALPTSITAERALAEVVSSAALSSSSS